MHIANYCMHTLCAMEECSYFSFKSKSLGDLRYTLYTRRSLPLITTAQELLKMAHFLPPFLNLMTELAVLMAVLIG